MNKRILVLTTLTLLLYWCVYLIPTKKEPPETIPTPVSILPICIKDDRVISLGLENNPICLHGTEVYLYIQSEKYSIYELNKEEIILGAFPHGIITLLGNSFLVTTFSTKGEIIATIPIPIAPNETYYGLFYYNDIVAFTTILEVQSPNEPKSRLIVLSNGKNAPPALKEFSLHDMVKVKDILNQDKKLFVSLEQPFEFLLPYTHFFDIEGGKIVTDSKIITSLPSSETEQHFVVGKEGEVYVDYSGTPYQLLPFLDTSKPYSLVGYTHTKTDKTVYNCKDFGQSLQITLRICTPSNEKTI